MIKELIKQLDGAELFLRNRADAEHAPLNEYDIETMYSISELINKTVDVLEKAIIPSLKIGDTVYKYNTDFSTVLPYKIKNIEIYGEDNQIKYTAVATDEKDEMIAIETFDVTDIGACIFLSENEA